MKSLSLYKQMENLHRLRAGVDGVHREEWLAESRKWRERVELKIESYLRARYVVRDGVEDTLISLTVC